MNELGAGPVGVDTAPFIYFIEEHPRYLAVLRELFTAADEGELEIVTSAITRLEVLVGPYRAANSALADRYEALLTRSRGVRLRDVDRSLLRAAAQLRGATGIRTPDALQLAAALSERCRAFVTIDRRLPSLPGLRIVQLDDFT